MKIEKQFSNEKIRYETVGSNTVFLKRNISPKEEISKEKLIEVKSVAEFRNNGIHTVKDALNYCVQEKGFQYVNREENAR